MTSTRPATTGRGAVRHGLAYAGFAVLPAAVAAWVLRGEPPGGVVRPGPAPAPGVQLDAAHLLLAVVLVVVAARVAGGLAERLGQPAVIGEIAAGVLLGPSAFGSVTPGLREELFGPGELLALGVLAQLGVVFFMFTVGAELRLPLLRACGSRAVVLGHTGIAVPFLGGVLLAVGPLAAVRPAGAAALPYAMFCGIALSVTAFPVLARILAERGMDGTRMGTLSLATAGVSDLTAWCLLAVVVATAGTSPGGPAGTLVLALGFCAVMWLLVRPALRWAAAVAAARTGAVAVVVLATLLASAAATDAIGVQPIFGAFLAGVIVPRDSPAVAELVERVLRPATWWLLPVFFAMVGLRTDIGALSATAWLLPPVIAVAVGGKVLGVAVPGLVTGMAPRPALALGVLMSCRGLTEIIVLQVGLSIGVLPTELFTCFVVMALVTTAATGPLLTLTGGD